VGQFAVTGATNPMDRTIIGYDSINNVGYLNAGESGVAWTNLILQGGGGNIGIGIVSPTAKLI